MNARQLKKRMKNSYYLGVLVAAASKMDELRNADVTTLKVKNFPISHNQHGFSAAASLGKYIFYKYRI